MYGPEICPILKVVVRNATANFTEPLWRIFPSNKTRPTIPTTPKPYAMQANSDEIGLSKKYKRNIPNEVVKHDKDSDI